MSIKIPKNAFNYTSINFIYDKLIDKVCKVYDNLINLINTTNTTKNN